MGKKNGFLPFHAVNTSFHNKKLDENAIQGTFDVIGLTYAAEHLGDFICMP